MSSIEERHPIHPDPSAITWTSVDAEQENHDPLILCSENNPPHNLTNLFKTSCCNNVFHRGCLAEHFRTTRENEFFFSGENKTVKIIESDLPFTVLSILCPGCEQGTIDSRSFYQLNEEEKNFLKDIDKTVSQFVKATDKNSVQKDRKKLERLIKTAEKFQDIVKIYLLSKTFQHPNVVNDKILHTFNNNHYFKCFYSKKNHIFDDPDTLLTQSFVRANKLEKTDLHFNNMVEFLTLQQGDTRNSPITPAMVILDHHEIDPRGHLKELNWKQPGAQGIDPYAYFYYRKLSELKKNPQSEDLAKMRKREKSFFQLYYSHLSPRVTNCLNIPMTGNEKTSNIGLVCRTAEFIFIVKAAESLPKSELKQNIQDENQCLQAIEQWEEKKQQDAPSNFKDALSQNTQFENKTIELVNDAEKNDKPILAFPPQFMTFLNPFLSVEDRGSVFTNNVNKRIYLMKSPETQNTLITRLLEEVPKIGPTYRTHLLDILNQYLLPHYEKCQNENIANLQVNNKKENPLHLAAQFPFKNKTKESETAVIEKLLELFPLALMQENSELQTPLEVYLRKNAGQNVDLDILQKFAFEGYFSLGEKSLPIIEAACQTSDSSKTLTYLLAIPRQSPISKEILEHPSVKALLLEGDTQDRLKEHPKLKQVFNSLCQNYQKEHPGEEK